MTNDWINVAALIFGLGILAALLSIALAALGIAPYRRGLVDGWIVGVVGVCLAWYLS